MQDVYWPIPGLITCAGGDWEMGLLLHAERPSNGSHNRALSTDVKYACVHPLPVVCITHVTYSWLATPLHGDLSTDI